MKPGMSSALTRNVWSRTTSAIVQPAASTIARTFSNACRVWLPTSGPATPCGPIPTCPATVTRSPPEATMPCEYIPSGGGNPLGVIVLATGASYTSRTYSKSTGWPLMPRAGGAIQFANFPGSVTGFMRFCT